MQKKKNVRLLTVLVVLVAVTIVVYFLDGSGDRIDVDKQLFAFENTADIDRVIIENGGWKNELAFESGKWRINGVYQADPQRIQVLFAVLKQNKVRRKVSKQARPKVDSLLAANKAKVTFMSAGEAVKSYEVVGDPDNLITYAIDNNEPYIIEIPGYRTYLANLYELDANGWRNPLVFTMNWSNLKKVSMVYPNKPGNQFDVSFDGSFYAIDQLEKTDSLKLIDFLDDVSLLLVNDYLYEKELADYEEQMKITQASILVSDVGDNFHTVEILGEVGNKDQILGKIDSTEYALFDYKRMRKILRPQNFFLPKK